MIAFIQDMKLCLDYELSSNQFTIQKLVNDLYCFDDGYFRRKEKK